MKRYGSLLICIWIMIVIFKVVNSPQLKYTTPFVNAIFAIYLTARPERERLSTGLISFLFGFFVIPIFLTNLKRPKSSIAPWLYKDPPEGIESQLPSEDLYQD